MMYKALRYVSISHKTASVKMREKFYVADEQKETVLTRLCESFPEISGLLLLVTCNRTELYFESDSISATEVLHFLVFHLVGERSTDYDRLFKVSDSTEATVGHLLEVSAGLVSKVLGDAEIICQLKKAYQLALQQNLQGSLLERAMQTVFKTHKRIQNETNFRDGTTSVAYKSLKMVNDTYGRAVAKEKKILFIGAGDIVKQLFKYNAKFGFENIAISNRTKSKALALTDKYLGQWFDWGKVLNNDFQEFDVIISAASNCPRLITEIKENSNPRLLIDLALPGNIDATLADKANVQFYDIDAISQELEANKEKRIAAVQQVNAVKEAELEQFKKWYQEAPLRALLADYKISLKHKIAGYLKNRDKPYDKARIQLISNRIMRNLIKQADHNFQTDNIEALVAQHTYLD